MLIHLQFLLIFYNRQLKNREISLLIKNIVNEYNQYMMARESKFIFQEYIHPYCKKTFSVSNDDWNEATSLSCEYYCEVDSSECDHIKEFVEIWRERQRENV